jgi:hypothetical protein
VQCGLEKFQKIHEKAEKSLNEIFNNAKPMMSVWGMSQMES